MPKKRLLKRRLVQAPQAPFKAPIHSKCCIGGFRETGTSKTYVDTSDKMNKIIAGVEAALA